ncbi:MAG: YCF48-related protein [Ignavibacteriales bacterium]
MRIKLLFVAILIFNLSVHSQNSPEWQRLPNAPIKPNGKFEDIFFINEQVGWTVSRTTSSSGSVFKTTDGGYSWIDQSFDSGLYLRCVGFIDENTGWVGDLNGNNGDFLYKTTTGGDSWFIDTNVPDTSILGLCGIYIVNDSVVYVCGAFSNDASMLKTTDKGNSWQYIDLRDYAKGVVDLFFFSPDTGFVVGMDTTGLFAVVLATYDGGNSWNIKHTSEHAEEWAWKINFPTRQIGYVSLQTFGNDLYFLKSSDGGNTWEDISFTAFNNFQPSGIGFVSESKGWQGTHPLFSNGYMMETTDGGFSWHVNESAININKFRILNDTLAYAAGETIYKYTSKLISDVYQNPVIVPEKFNLAQNFPNPFNPITTIMVTIPTKAITKLEVFNSQGQLVETLINGILDPNEYEIRVIAYKWSSGVYFYQLTSDGIDGKKFQQTKKMILLK